MANRLELKPVKRLVDRLLGIKVLYKGSSPYGPLWVYEERGTLNLVSGDKLTQSSYRPSSKPLGSVWDHFLLAPLFAPDPAGVRRVCILGLGAGAAVKLLNRAYRIKRIVGVEIDSKVVELGKRFFDLNDRNLEIVVEDASKYVKKAKEKFSLVIVDAFKGDKIAPECSNREFYLDVAQLLKPEGVVLINRVDPLPLEVAALFPQCYALSVRRNTFYFGLQVPQDKEKIVQRIKTLAAKNAFMGFLKRFDEKNLSQVDLTLSQTEALPRSFEQYNSPRTGSV